MRDRSKSPVKSPRLINSLTSLILPDDEIVNGKISGNTARDIIYGNDLKHCNRIAINHNLYFL
jgi:hypothetical protein